MNRLTLDQFLKEPDRVVCNAAEGEYTTVHTGDGKIAVIIDDAEWTMLRQALVICMEHPEWTNSNR